MKRKSAGVFVAAGITAAVMAVAAPPGGAEREPDWGAPPSVRPDGGERPVTPPANPVKAMLLNPLVVSTLRLTPEQRAAVASLDEEATKQALMVSFITQILRGLVSDADLGAKIGVTPAQAAQAVRAVTPALVRSAFSVAQMEQIMRSVLAPDGQRAAPRGMRPPQ
jgi:hypothetical protein